MKDDPQAQQIVSELIADHGFNGAVERIPANKGLIYRVWKDGLHSPTVREALDLPPKTVPIPPCPDCGHVHEQKQTCPDKLEEQRAEGRTKANGWLRRAGWLTTEQAARFDAARKAAGASVADILVEWTEKWESE